MMLKPTLILGLGNTLMTDEGIGVRIAQELMRRGDLPGNTEVLDLGTGGLRALHLMKDRSRVLFIDCAFMGETPGTMRRFTPADVRTAGIQTRLSMHESDLLRTIELSRELGECPDTVLIFGIEPERVEPGEHLTPLLAGRLPAFALEIRNALEPGQP